MQNPPSYVQVDSSKSYPSSPYAGMMRGDGELPVFTPHMGHHAGMSMQQIPAHTNLMQMKHPHSAGMMSGIPGLPSSSHHRYLENAHHHHAANISEAFVNSFGLPSGATFLNPYYADHRNRSPSPLMHRILQRELLGGMPSSSAHLENHYLADDSLLDPPVFSRSQSSMSGHVDRHHLDPMIGSGHLSRSLDDLSAVLDNSNDNDSLDLSYQRTSTSPNDSLVSCNELTQSEHNSVSSSFAHAGAAKSSYKHRRSGAGVTGRAEVSRTCQTCGKTFGNSSGLAKHRLTHSDERKYLCTTCMKSFKRQDHLTGHMLTHSDKKPFSCPVDGCGKSYCDSRSLKRHLDQHEPWMVPNSARLMFNDNLPEELEDSQLAFDDLPEQKAITDSCKPYVCSICRRRFKNGPALNGHMRLHGGFFNKKVEDLSPQVAVSADSTSHSPDNYSPPFDTKVSPPSYRMNSSWSSPPDDTSSSLNMLDNTSIQNFVNLNHVPVIRHTVPSPTPTSPTVRTPTLPPVSTLASPSNSPTSLHSPFSFFTPPSMSQVTSSFTASLSAANEKIRRHSDSDSYMQSKRPCTNTDMLRRAMTLNMERNMRNEAPADLSSGETSIFFNYLPHYRQDSSIAEEPDSLRDLSEDSAGLADVLGDDDVMLDESPAGDVFADSPQSSSNASSFTNSVEVEAPPTPEPGSSMSSRRKHRPSPLFIPPHASHETSTTQQPALSPGVGFSSNLRSPRFRDEKSATPPPYTPPPMLSPNRSGSGLYWNVLSSSATTPQTGSSKFLLRRSLSNTSTGHLDSNMLLNSSKNSSGGIAEFNATKSPFTFITTPETDSHPHINIGPGHQADLPQLHADTTDANLESLREDLLWSPKMVSNLSDHEVLSFVSIAETSAVGKGGQNKELAYHILFVTGGDLTSALNALLRPDYFNRHLPSRSTLRTYHYQNSVVWSPEEITAFSALLLKHDKDFFLVADKISTKTVKHCVEFYYVWKKILAEDYRRARTARRRRQADLIVLTRSRVAEERQPTVDIPKIVVEEQNPEKSLMCHYPGCRMEFPTNQAFATHSRTHTRSTSRVSVNLDTCPPPEPKPVSASQKSSTASKENTKLPISVDNSVAEFPCRICEKSFHGVKSRNAHMKVHRPAEPRAASIIS